MEKLKAINKSAWDYLSKFPPNSWSRAYFSEQPKVDTLCNNNCEVFNAKIVKYRGKPILKMLEEIRSYIMRNMASNKRSLSGWLGELTPVQQKRLDKEKILSNKWRVQWAGDCLERRFQVEMYGMTMDVDIDKKTCTCRLWQISGMPCRHAIASMASWGLQPEEFVHNWLKMPAFKAAYEEFIRPCRSQHFWTTTEFVAPIPPLIKRKAGRPKKTRRKGEDEGGRPGKMKKNTIPMHCGIKPNCNSFSIFYLFLFLQV
jgi:hypothetical protein